MAGRHLAVGLLPFVLVSAACAGGETADRRAAAADSTGIPVVENDAPVWSDAEVPHLSARPTLVIGDRLEPEYVLSRVAGTVRLSDGRIVVADGGSLELRFFDGKGEFLRSVGRRGAGPGEFDRLDALVKLAGDTLAVVSIPGTISFFAPSGEFLRRVEASRLPTGLPGPIKIVLTAFDDQTVVVGSIPMPVPRAAGTSWVDSMPLVAVGRDTAVRVSLGTFPAWQTEMVASGPQHPRFGPTAIFGAGGGDFFIGYGSDFAIRVFSSDGRLDRVIRRRWTPVRVTSADIDEFVTEWAKRWIKATGPEAERQKRDLRDDPYADEVPAFAQFLVDHDGRLWVREAHLADVPAAGQWGTAPLVPSVWSVFDRDGHWLGDVTMPAQFMPNDIGPDYVLGVAYDGDVVQTVVQYTYGTGAR